MRDNFPSGVKRILALRVGSQCSNPTCGAKTSGPQIDPANAINIGVAAHITAASVGGPRYHVTVSEAERMAPKNGIWLCQNCAKMIDNDVERFPESLLRHWKEVAEQRALSEMGRQSPFDRTSAPALEMPPAGLSQMSVSLRHPLTPETLRQLPALLSPEDRDGEIQLLASGRGAMEQQYAILGTGADSGWTWTIALFTGGEFGWEPVANLHLESQKGLVPEAAYVSGTPGALVITHVSGYGTGVFRRSTSWYRIAKGEPSPLLSYPDDFYVMGWGMPFGRELKSTTLRIPSHLAQGAPLDLRFDVSYTMLDPEVGEGEQLERELFAISEPLSLEWNDVMGVFVPRTPSDDFAKVEEIWTEGTDQFVERNTEILHHLAQHGTPTQKSFIQTRLLRST